MYILGYFKVPPLLNSTRSLFLGHFPDQWGLIPQLFAGTYRGLKPVVVCGKLTNVNVKVGKDSVATLMAEVDSIRRCSVTFMVRGNTQTKRNNLA